VNVLITGCAGFIGCHATKRFLESGATVIGIDNLSRKGSDENLKWLKSLSKGKLKSFKKDIRNFKGISDIFKKEGPFDLVLHEAGQVAVTTSVVNPREDFEINALGTFNILEATRLHSPEAFFEFSSTNKVYGGMEQVNVIQRNGRYEYESLKDGIHEDFCIDFHSPYGCSKGSADQYVRDYSRIYELRTAVLRQSCIYGTRQFGIEDQGWVAWFIIASILNKPITIYGDGMQIRDVLWIDDLIDVYIKLYQNADKVSGNIFNVGGGPSNTMSILELVKYLREEGVLNQSPAFGEWRAGDQKVYVSNINKIENVIDWKPMVSPQQGIKKLIEWAKENNTLLSNTLN
jgi:CDP-paratose 2-epimerase